ncbi:MAG: SCP2 sterol-binding domain-containing protein [Butyrivibrio sp.]|uniref:SCP2 sterol-binding domain-containing protein n=1 Tax=Butyrivibrio sp. NC2002 TaxID=1410610 RepID=UPI000562BFE7|nr:SCP2 sterol-binding domain-containing protein [Butyrivibrio sp. NC2002]MBE5860618.1 SCP2 sterol-binding domain-containing protein [Butyrivibrio sp.]
MKINIYYGGRGIIDDPTLYVISRMSDVFKELNVQVEQFNLFEQKNGITALPATLKNADGVILASTVEWFGVGGYIHQFLDACWLYGDKNKLSGLYMAPVVMSTTHGEREGMMELSSAWEILGGIPLDGLCGYIADFSSFESNDSYKNLIEKKAENIYRSMSQKMESLPTSNQAVEHAVSKTKMNDFTPQETEALSRYISNEEYVQKQKEDIQELSSIFRNKMDKEHAAEHTEDFISSLKSHFKPVAGLHAVYQITLLDQIKDRDINIKIENSAIEIKLGEAAGCDVHASLNTDVLEQITSGRMTFQRAFMEGNLKMKGDFKLLRNMDQLFDFK